MPRTDIIRIIGSAAVRRSTSVWSFAEKIDSPPFWDHPQGRDTRSNQLRPALKVVPVSLHDVFSLSVIVCTKSERGKTHFA
jgi:hypothetical protein